MANCPVCALCGQDCSSGPRLKDSRERYFHRACYDEAKRQRDAREGRTGASTKEKEQRGVAVTPPRASTTFNVGDHVGCSNPQCGARFAIADERTAAIKNLVCPTCQARLVLLQKKPPVVQAPPPAPDLSDLFDEVMPTNDGGTNRVRLLELLQLQDSGQRLNPQREAEKRHLLGVYRSTQPFACPRCSAATAATAVLCVACGLHLVDGTTVVRRTKTKHPLIEKAERELAEKEAAAARENTNGGGGGGSVAADIGLTILGKILGGL